MTPRPLAGSQRWLCGLDFFISDVRDGLGSFPGVFPMAHAGRPVFQSIAACMPG